MATTRVLLVDDDDRLREVLHLILEDDGHEIVASLEDGTHASRLVDELQPDVVLLDLVLPTMGGLDVAEAIRAVRPDQPIVLFTSLFDPRIENMALAHRLVYLDKCEGLSALEHAIDAAIERMGAMTATPA